MENSYMVHDQRASGLARLDKSVVLHWARREIAPSNRQVTALQRKGALLEVSHQRLPYNMMLPYCENGMPPKPLGRLEILNM